MTQNDHPLPPDDGRPLVVADPDDPALRHLAVVGDTYTILVTGEQTAGRYALIDMLIPAGGGPPPHRHDRSGPRPPSPGWTALIVLVLRDGPLRFSQLRTRVGDVTAKVLAETLRRLERDGILSRTAYAEVPPRVEYELTALGYSLAEPIAAITSWAEEHMRHISRARERYDRRVA